MHLAQSLVKTRQQLLLSQILLLILEANCKVLQKCTLLSTCIPETWCAHIAHTTCSLLNRHADEHGGSVAKKIF